MDRAYEVLKITELMRLGATGGVEKYYKYTIKTRLGTVMSADIGESDATPEKASKILTQLASNLDKTMMPEK